MEGDLPARMLRARTHPLHSPKNLLAHRKESPRTVQGEECRGLVAPVKMLTLEPCPPILQVPVAASLLPADILGCRRLVWKVNFEDCVGSLSARTSPLKTSEKEESILLLPVLIVGCVAACS